MLLHIISTAVFVGHPPSPPSDHHISLLYQPVERHVFGADTFCHQQPSRVELIRLHLLSPSPLGTLLCKNPLLLHAWSRLFIAFRCILLLPSMVLQTFFPTPSHRADVVHFSPPPIHVSPMVSLPIPIPHAPSSFDFRLRLASELLPLALNAQVTRSDFDPDSVATLLSRHPGPADVVDVILDTGCTSSITPDRRDFVTYEEGSDGGQVQTVNGPTTIAGTGIVRWTLISDDGQHLDLYIPCHHHVPASTVRLLSPQDFCQYHGFDRSRDQFGGKQFQLLLDA